MSDDLSVLLTALTSAVHALSTSLQSDSLPPFSLADPSPHILDTSLSSPSVWYARKAIVGLCGQMIALVQSPAERVSIDALRGLLPAALNVVVERKGSLPSIADLIAAKGSEGASVQELAEKTGVRATKLRSIFRILTSEGYFRELVPGRYALNRPGSALVSSNPRSDGVRFSTGPGLAAVAALSSTALGDRDEPAWQVAHGSPLFPWFAANPSWLQAFHMGQTSLESTLDPGLVPDFPWEELGETVTLVDVGAGKGGMSMQLLRRFKGWKAVLLDRSEVVDAAREYWQTQAPELVQTDHVQFRAHDFLTPLTGVLSQDPARAKSETGSQYVFLLKNVLHDWSDETCVQILRNIAAAALPDSILLIASYCPSPPDPATVNGSGQTMGEFFTSIEGKSMRQIQQMSTGLHAPKPLGPDWGFGGAWLAVVDAFMLTTLNARGRDEPELKALLDTAGWELKRTTPLRASLSILQAVKA